MMRSTSSQEMFGIHILAQEENRPYLPPRQQNTIKPSLYSTIYKRTPTTFFQLSTEPAFQKNSSEKRNFARKPSAARTQAVLRSPKVLKFIEKMQLDPSTPLHGKKAAPIQQFRSNSTKDILSYKLTRVDQEVLPNSSTLLDQKSTDYVSQANQILGQKVTTLHPPLKESSIEAQSYSLTHISAVNLNCVSQFESQAQFLGSQTSKIELKKQIDADINSLPINQYALEDRIPKKLPHKVLIAKFTRQPSNKNLDIHSTRDSEQLQALRSFGLILSSKNFLPENNTSIFSRNHLQNQYSQNLALQTSESTTPIFAKSKISIPKAPNILNMIDFLENDTPIIDPRNYLSKNAKTTPKRERFFPHKHSMKENKNLEALKFDLLTKQSETELPGLKYSQLHKKSSMCRNRKISRHFALSTDMRATISTLPNSKEISRLAPKKSTKSVVITEKAEQIDSESTQMAHKHETNKISQFFDMILHAKLDGWSNQENLEGDVREDNYP